jgi:GGDEF domain-containing protein
MTDHWVVVLEAIGSDGTVLGDHVMDRLLDQVRDCNPSALHATGRYALQLLLTAESGLEAHAVAVDRWLRALAAIGAPAWRAVRVEVLTLEEFERECAAAGFRDGPSAMAAPASCGTESDWLLRSVFEDPLTRLPTAELLRAKVEATLRTPERPGTTHALLMLQLIDRSTSDSTHGGVAPDDVVVLDVVRRLSAIMRRDDILARVDRRTFAVLASGIASPGAAALARRAASLVPVKDQARTDEHFAVSAGIALSETGWNAGRLFAAAAQALVSAKTAPEGWALFRTDAGESTQLPPNAFEAESCADEC